jgi:energy-coupling factor transporter ATP-binding protein EcfA2
MLLQKRIHEWSKGLPAWQSDLLRRLVVGALTDADRAEVKAILTGAAGAPVPVPLQLHDLPADEDEHGRVELRSIGDFRNINCLAENQTLYLQPGLNVVFGPNGSGKTGHGRLLRGVCRAAEREQVLPNVFGPTKIGQSQTATIGITVDGVAQTVGVDLAQQPDRVLSAISVFDACCARIFVSRPNVIDYVPRSLVVLRTLAEEQDAIAASLRDDATRMRMSLPVLPELADGTAAAAALVDLGPKTNSNALEQLAELSDAEAMELEQLETAAATIRADKSGELERAARARATGATAAAAAIHEAAGRVDSAVLVRIAETRQRLDAVATAERELVDKAFTGSRFPAVGGEPWREMWSAIVRYVEAGGGTFPSAEPGAVCPTCEQELSPEAATRLANAQQFVGSELRQRAAALDEELQKLLAAAPDAEALNTRVTSELRDAPQEVCAAGTGAVSAIASRASRARALAAGEPVGDDQPPAVDVALIEAYATAQTDAADARAALRDTDKQQEVMRTLAGLQARRTLHEHLPALKQRIETLKEIAALDAAAGKLSTQSISLQLRKLQEAEITERLRTAIQEELKHTTLAAKVAVVGQASKGETKIQLKLAKGCKEKVESVLSGGQQAALGTAFFLAELAVSASESAIALEDPVSSLDHDHREYLAHRLVEESKKRQVVIYTHDLSFLIYLQDAAVQEDVDLHGHTLESSLDEAGIVREGLPTKLMSPADRRKELRRRLKFELNPMFKGKKPEYERDADLWVGDLRKAYDQLIEDYVLAGTVRRFSQHVRVRHLFMITWTPEIASRIEAAMKQASPKTHHEATELYPRAYTPDELEAMFDEFEEICELTAPKNGKAAAGKGGVNQESEQTTLEDELVAKVATLPQAS